MAKPPKPPRGVQVKNGRYYRPLYLNGKHKWHALTRVDDGLPALYRALAELSSARSAGSSMKTRLEDWMKDALPGLSAAEQRETIRMKAVISDAFDEFDVADVKAGDIHEFLQHWVRAGKKRMAQSYRAKLSKFFRWAILKGDRHDNPVDPVRTQAPAPLMRYIDDDAFTLIRDKLMGDEGHKAASGEMMQIYVDLAYLTGHGGVDIRTLRWSQVNENDGTIHVARSKVKGKTGAKVDITITPAIRAVLDRASKLKMDGCPYVVHNLGGEAYTAHGINTAWRRARERAFAENNGRTDLMTFTVKDLRAKFATDAKAAGYTDEQIAAGMAHVDTSMTTRYLKKRMAKKSHINLEIPE